MISSLSLSLSPRQGPPEFDYYVSYLNKTSIRKAIHVGNLTYGSQSDAVEMALINVRFISVLDHTLVPYNGSILSVI